MGRLAGRDVRSLLYFLQSDTWLAVLVVADDYPEVLRLSLRLCAARLLFFLFLAVVCFWLEPLFASRSGAFALPVPALLAPPPTTLAVVDATVPKAEPTLRATVVRRFLSGESCFSLDTLIEMGTRIEEMFAFPRI